MVINNRLRLSSSTMVSSAKQRRYIYIQNGHNDSTVDMNQCHNRVRRLSLLTLFYFCQHPPRIKEVLKYMAEAIISRRGGGSGGGNMIAEVIMENTQWVVPAHKGNISVRIFGGGSSGEFNTTTIGTHFRNKYTGGGGGWMNNGEFNIPTGEVIPITIGDGGIILDTGKNIGYRPGGTSSFGTYLSANGGGLTSGGSTGGIQFISNDVSIYIYTAGQFGGGGVYTSQYSRNDNVRVYGSTGGTWGGGGGVYLHSYFSNNEYVYGGGGGTYGGGGAAYLINSRMNNTMINSHSTYGRKGTYGGNGGTYLINANNGTNTMGYSNIPNNCRGNGNGGGKGYGGGGYGGDGGMWGGGGGYGGNGKGGGGGYGRGADGGDGHSGGGGGYFSRGGNASSGAGGGGGYGNGGDGGKDGGIAAGGGSGGNGGKGICIIQYYT